MWLEVFGKTLSQLYYFLVFTFWTIYFQFCVSFFLIVKNSTQPHEIRSNYCVWGQCNTKMNIENGRMGSTSGKNDDWMHVNIFVFLLFYTSTYTIYTVSEKVLPPRRHHCHLVFVGECCSKYICLRGVFIKFVHGLRRMFGDESAVSIKMITIFE